MTRKKRRPFVAALLSLLMPGLGQLYAGRARRAAVLLMVFIAIYWGLLLGFVPLDQVFRPPAGFWTAASVLALLYGWFVFAVIDAFIVARRAGLPVLLAFQRWYVYLGVYIIAGGLIWLPALLPDGAPLRPIAFYSIPSGSMTPTLLPGDYIVASGLWYRDHPPVRGDIAIHVRSDGTAYVQRIVGLSGERLQMKGGIVYIDDVAIPRAGAGDYLLPRSGHTFAAYRETPPDGASYLVIERGEADRWDDSDVIAIPADAVFVLGDNRDNSMDSRSFGVVQNSRLRDKPLYIWWSADLTRIGTRIQ